MKAIMTRRLLFAFTLILFASAISNAQQGARGQEPPIVRQDPKTLRRDAHGRPDLTGMWNIQYTPDISTAVPGGKIPFTPYGQQRWKDVDTAKDPTGFCLPVGPSRAFTSPFPVYFLQTPNVIGALFEYQTIWRMFYIGGKHPDDMGAYAAEFMGHSTAEWQGDILVVDTIGIAERSWLDTAGHEHSDKLHLTERFEKINDDTIQYTVTYEDPVFFSEPFSITRHMRRGAAKDRILPYTCTENNVDTDHLVPSKREQ